MRLRSLAVTLAAVVAAASFGAFTGWLKSVYFLRPFGLSPAALDPGPAAMLLESWYVIQNVVYFTWVVWLVVQTRRLSLAVVAVVYAAIPLSTHYAFLGYRHSWLRWWVDHQHAWLKLIPLLMLAGVLLAWMRGKPVPWRWPHGRAGWVVLAVVAASWGVSAAKHFGSYDAERVLHRPEELLARVEVAWSSPPPAGWTDAPLFLLHADERNVIVVAFAGSGWERRRPGVRSIRRDELREFVVTPASEVQPGGQYL